VDESEDEGTEMEAMGSKSEESEGEDDTSGVAREIKGERETMDTSPHRRIPTLARPRLFGFNTTRQAWEKKEKWTSPL